MFSVLILIGHSFSLCLIQTSQRNVRMRLLASERLDLQEPNPQSLDQGQTVAGLAAPVLLVAGAFLTPSAAAPTACRWQVTRIP